MVEATIKGLIVIVDDNDLTRALLRGLLTAEGYQVVGEANNGEQGLEMALRVRPDLICLDVNMPRTDGLTVLKQLQDQAPELGVVMVTGSADRATVQAAIGGGAAGFIVKPFNSGRVLATIEGAMKKMKAMSRPASAAAVVVEDGVNEAAAHPTTETPAAG